MIGLVISGITAFPAETELLFLKNNFSSSTLLGQWFHLAYEGVAYANSTYPFLSYGTDWLAFAHIAISIFFIGVYKDPVKNIWITQTGMIACILVFPLAFIAGYVRDIPLFWQLIDCSFGGFGLIPLILIHKKTKELESFSTLNSQTPTL